MSLQFRVNGIAELRLLAEAYNAPLYANMRDVDFLSESLSAFLGMKVLVDPFIDPDTIQILDGGKVVKNFDVSEAIKLRKKVNERDLEVSQGLQDALAELEAGEPNEENQSD